MKPEYSPEEIARAVELIELLAQIKARLIREGKWGKR